MTTKNIVLFGQSGAGKSSVVNLIAAGQVTAQTSPGTERCTMHWEEYSITFNAHSYKVFDTVGLEEPQLGKKEYLNIIVNAHNLISKLQQEDGIDLLLFCVRAGRFSSTIRNNYRLFYEWLCEKKVPIVLVLTGLEREHRMEDWWTTYKSTFDKYDIVVDGHACITAASGLDGRHQLRYEESRHLVRNLIIEQTHSKQESAGNGGKRYKGDEGNEGWFPRFIRKLGLLRVKPAPRKDIVTVLTKRCGMSRETALELARQINQSPT